MRRLEKSLTAIGLFAAALGLSRQSAAQADVNPPMPNVMLLVDSSGSMEYKSSSAQFPSCNPGGATPSERSRWVELVEVLGGSIQDYRCQAVDRNSQAFKQEYSLSGVPPADLAYINPYHRPLSGNCTPGPGTLPANPYEYPSGAIRYHHYGDPLQTCASFQQSSDGLLDAFQSRVRFGLMTFDTDPHPGTGVAGSTANFNSGTRGTWSYFLGSATQGKPAACATLQNMEVGARNAAAPPWEGRMVAFGPPFATAAQISARNQQIQEILLATRPFGATPIAGMLDDVRNFLWNDTSVDPLDSSQNFGPYNDPYIKGGCRENFVILLSDGEPNLDLRPFCEAAGPPAGVCPFEKPEEIAFNMATASDPTRRTKTFVIGFAVSQVTLQGVTPVDCEKLTESDLTSAAGLCAQNPDERALQACCNLSRIAFNGGTSRAYFADDKDELRQALSAVLSTISASTTSRTLPVFATAPATTGVGNAFAAGYRFYSSFEPQQFTLWSGVVERQRFTCEKDPVTGELTPQAEDLDVNKGDDFVANVNSGSGPARRFVSVQGQTLGGKIFSERSIRPKLAGNPDGAGEYVGEQYQNEAGGFVDATPPAAMSLDGTTCAGLTPDQCRNKFLKWNLGLDNGTAYHRCKVPGSIECSLVGDIYHSTPRVVGQPSEFLRDESYQLFAAKQATRPLVLYTSTNDGFLHAFKVAAADKNDPLKVDKKENNELWAFIPPAVLPAIPAQYPGTHQLLLDGVPVVNDVVATEVNGVMRFERSPGQAQAGQGTWRTVLIQSFGAARGGYFALDVTDPVPSADGSKGPKFLWQLTSDTAGNPLFGKTGATPLITTLFVDIGNNDTREIAVAVLPGGEGGAPSASACDRADPTPDYVDSSFAVRSKINCYQPSGARSLTIVRLDTGEILRTFRRDAADAPAGLAASGRVTQSPIDSPITGVPVAFPGSTGAIADRIFVGDRDGTLWRVDVASTDPAKWSMRAFFDAFSGLAFDAGQTIQTPPVLSVDTTGNVTIAFSTGDQEVLTAPPGMKNFVFSLTEKLDAAGSNYESKVNWYTTFSDGERVAGPMTLFNGALFFSSFKPVPPNTTAVCSAGTSRVWGMDYVVPKAESDRSLGGLERMPDGSNTAQLVQFIDSTSSLLQAGAIIFGVGVAQLPSCTDEVNVDDPYFGPGMHTSISNVRPGKFQLVMHTGNVGQAVPGGRSNVLTIDLPAPPSTARIDSWAAIVE
jgi:type IV pilus assembly protein PilY1